MDFDKNRARHDVIAILGSARRNGNTRKLLNQLAQAMTLDIVDLADKQISPYDYEHRNMNDDFILLMKQVISHDKIILASPVYWYGPSAQMKTFIDRTSDFLAVEALKTMGRQLRGKTGYIVCTSVSSQADASFVNSIRMTFEHLGMRYGGHLHANCREGYVAAEYAEEVSRFSRIVRGTELQTAV